MTWHEFESLKPGDLVVYKSKGAIKRESKSYNGLVLEVEEFGIFTNTFNSVAEGVKLKQPGFDGGFRTVVCVPQQLDIYKGCAK